jgi:hypothetical protein
MLVLGSICCTCQHSVERSLCYTEKPAADSLRYLRLEMHHCLCFRNDAYSSVFASPSRVELTHVNGLDCTSEAYECAAGKHADIAALAKAHEVGMAYTDSTMAGAAQCNKIAEVQYLHSQGCPWSYHLLEGACRFGHFKLVRWCYEHGCRWQQASEASCYAAQSGNVELMAWVLQQPGAKLSKSVMSHAAAKGHTAMCQYLYTQRCPWSDSSTRNAAMYGHVSTLRWLVDNSCPWVV